MRAWTMRGPIWMIVGLATLAYFPPLAHAQELPSGREAPAQAAYQPCAVEPCSVSVCCPGQNCCPSPCCIPTDCCTCPRPGYFRVIPYAWVPGFEGDLTVRNRTAAVDASIGKVWDVIVDTIDIGGMGQVEASNGTFGVIFNGIYVDVGPSSRTGNLVFDTDLRITLLDLVGTYQPQWLNDRLPSGGRFEFLAGARYYALSSTVTISGNGVLGGRSVTAGGTEDWVDALVGARLRLPLSQRLTGQVRGDIGGFGISGSSDFSWNIEAILEYRCSCCCSLFGGWRWLDVDYSRDTSNGRFSFDMNLSGPMLGIALNF